MQPTFPPIENCRLLNKSVAQQAKMSYDPMSRRLTLVLDRGWFDLPMEAMATDFAEVERRVNIEELVDVIRSALTRGTIYPKEMVKA
jgi:hypothetical protein